jgi:hypothetical protein
LPPLLLVLGANIGSAINPLFEENSADSHILQDAGVEVQ